MQYWRARVQPHPWTGLVNCTWLNRIKVSKPLTSQATDVIGMNHRQPRSRSAPFDFGLHERKLREYSRLCWAPMRSGWTSSSAPDQLSGREAVERRPGRLLLRQLPGSLASAGTARSLGYFERRIVRENRRHQRFYAAGSARTLSRRACLSARAARACHPNIVPIYGSLLQGKKPTSRRPSCSEGQNLRQFIRTGRRSSWSRPRE